MKSRLSPELQNIEDRFIDNFAEGGLQAASRFVDELIIETSAYMILYDEVDVIEIDQEENIIGFDPLLEPGKVINVCDLMDGLKEEAGLACGRLALGLTLLDKVGGGQR